MAEPPDAPFPPPPYDFMGIVIPAGPSNVEIRDCYFEVPRRPLWKRLLGIAPPKLGIRIR